MSKKKNKSGAAGAEAPERQESVGDTEREEERTESATPDASAGGEKKLSISKAGAKIETASAAASAGAADAEDESGASDDDDGDALAPADVTSDGPPASTSRRKRAAPMWPADKDHRSATEMMRGVRAEKEVDLSVDEELLGSNFLNAFLLILILGAAIGGVIMLNNVSSEETLAAKRAERERAEQEHLEKQLALQKKYGILRIESNPPQADVYKDGEKVVTTNEATGEEIVGRTPMNMMDLDISQQYTLKIEKDGYEPFEFHVSEHLWTKDAAMGEYKFFKMVELNPNVCEYWFLYDAKQKREVKFPEKTECLEHHDKAVSAGTSVTDCTCKIPPEGFDPDKAGKK